MNLHEQIIEDLEDPEVEIEKEIPFLESRYLNNLKEEELVFSIDLFEQIKK